MISFPHVCCVNITYMLLDSLVTRCVDGFLVALMSLYVWYVLQVYRYFARVIFQDFITFREGIQPSYSLICSGYEPFRPEEQLLSTEGAIFRITNMVTPLGRSENLSWSNLPQSLNSCLNPGSISNSLQLDLPFDLVILVWNF